MNALLSSCLSHPESTIRVMIDCLRREPDAGGWLILCDALDEAGVTTADVCEMYAAGGRDTMAYYLRCAVCKGTGDAGGHVHERQWAKCDECAGTGEKAVQAAEDDSLRPLLAAWAESRVSRKLAGRVRAWNISEDGRVVRLYCAGLNRHTFNNLSAARVSLKRRVLSEFLDAPILGPHAGRRATRRALAELRERLKPYLQTDVTLHPSYPPQDNVTPFDPRRVPNIGPSPLRGAYRAIMQGEAMQAARQHYAEQMAALPEDQRLVLEAALHLNHLINMDGRAVIEGGPDGPRILQDAEAERIWQEAQASGITRPLETPDDDLPF